MTLGLADAELCTTTTVDPDAAAVDAPCVVAYAGGTADLAGELNITTAADVTPVSAAVVGGTGDCAPRRPPRAVVVVHDHKLGATAAVDPKAATVDAPCVVAYAS